LSKSKISLGRLAAFMEIMACRYRQSNVVLVYRSLLVSARWSVVHACAVQKWPMWSIWRLL